MSDIHFGKHEQNQHLFQMNISMKPSKIHLMVIIIQLTEKLRYHKTVNLHHPCQLVYIISAFPVQSTKASSCTSSQCKQANFLFLFYTLVFVCFVLFFILFFTFFICQTTWISYKPSWFSQERLPARQAHNAIKQTFVQLEISNKSATVLFRTAWFSQQKLQKLKLFCCFSFLFFFVFYSLLFVIFSDTSNIISDLRMLPQPVWFSQQRQLSTQCKQAKSVLLFYIFLLQLCVFLCQFYQAALFSQQRQPGSQCKQAN